MSQFAVVCSKCKTEYTASGAADYESVGDGGPAECTNRNALTAAVTNVKS